MRERIARLIGTTRRARLLSAATAGAIVVAVGAFLALQPSEDGITEDSFTQAVDRSCVEEKGRISTLEQQKVQQRLNVEQFSAALVSIVEEWRMSLRQSPVPLTHAEAVRSLDSALLDVLIRAGALARVARSGSPAQIAVKAQLVDDAGVQVDQAIEGLGLTHCSDVGVGLVGVDRP
ncbi:MAG TPA: hypothetical protein VIE64_00095 [Solirubrobacterales bacterium]